MGRVAPLAALAATLLAWQGVASAGSVWVPGLEGVSNVPVRTLLERKFDKVIRQQYDFSCGSAALATLLTYHYADPTTEQETFTEMYRRGDQAKIRQVGFSLLDMKNYLEASGYQADGYQAPLETLAQAGVAAIALINTKGYQHFVVVKGLENGTVLVGDPALGSRTMSRRAFEAVWPNQLLFIVRNRSEVGRRYFNAPDHWQSVARAPLGTAVDRQTLDSIMLSLPPIAAHGLTQF